jgi:ketosteroid isomerase-like protein
MTTHRRFMQLCSVALVALPLTVASGQAKQQSSSAGTASARVRTAIDAANKRFVDLFNKGDAAGAAKIYATDAVLMPPNADFVKGDAAISGFWQGAYKNGVRNVSLATVGFGVEGNYATELGTYQLEVHDADGKVLARDNGKYMVLWKRSEGGRWQWYRDIYNTSVPAQAK